MQPKLTFFCELPESDLAQLFADDKVFGQISLLQSGISLALMDFSAGRANLVKRLNQAGIPVTAWLVLSKEEGYWFNTQNVHLAIQRYRQFLDWTKQNNLQWDAIGLDIEPDYHEMTYLHGEARKLLPVLWRRITNPQALVQAHAAYNGLVAAIRHDGYRVESYQFPLIVDERKASSNLLQRIAGIVNLDVDREVLMLYASFFRPSGENLLLSYGKDAAAIAIGSTGGGVEIKGVIDVPPLTWEELQRNLILANRFNKPIYIFSLEGCIRQGFLEKIREMEWADLIKTPKGEVRKVTILRRFLQGSLWAGSRPLVIVLFAALVIWLIKKLDKKKK